jgi:hypothetical protein
MWQSGGMGSSGGPSGGHGGNPWAKLMTKFNDNVKDRQQHSKHQQQDHHG